MQSPKVSGFTLVLFCVLAMVALPFTILCAIIAGLGGDPMLLRALRGKSTPEIPPVDNSNN